MSEIAFRTDKEWSVIDGEPCRVKDFFAAASIVNGDVKAWDTMAPYGSFDFECAKLTTGVTGFITHKADFYHLWSAYNDDGVREDEEVIVHWTKKYLKGLKGPKRFLPSATMPGLWVMICPEGAFDLMTDPNFRPELAGAARDAAKRPRAQWAGQEMIDAAVIDAL